MSRVSAVSVVCGLFVSGLLFATAAPAQDTSSGAIRGTVGDAAGARIGASSVVLVNTATNFRYSTTTDGFGRFVFELLPPGDYSARAESPGMSPQTTPGLHVDVGGTTELAFQTGSRREPGNGHGFGRAAAGRKRSPADSRH